MVFMNFVSVALFFLYSYCVGLSITFFLKASKHSIERIIMRIGIGLGVIPILGVIINFLHIPLDWRVLLIISLPIPIYLAFKNIKKLNPKVKLTKQNIYAAAVFVLFIFSFYMYTKGAFSYPYMEDDDSWGHALSTVYIAREKTSYEPIKGKDYFYFIDPYPPGYDILMAILYQTSHSIMWTLKFFTSLIVSLCTLFIYFFVKEFSGDRRKALFSAFALAMIPSFATHFIWALSLAIALFFPMMYCVVMIKHDKKWLIPAAVVLASINVIQPTHAMKINAMLFLYFIAKSILEKKIDFKVIGSQILAGLLSLVWWAHAYKALLDVNIASNLSKKIGPVAGNIFMKIWLTLRKRFPPGSGTATREYTFSDFFIAKGQGLINNPVGVGIVISLLVIIGVIYILLKYKSLSKAENHWKTITLVWLLFAFLGVNSLTFHLPFGLFAFRFWMILAIPICIIASEGFIFLTHLANPKIYRIFIGALIIIGVILSSGIQKYSINTAMWGPGGSWDYFQEPNQLDEVNGYLWLLNLPYGTKVFPLAGGHSVANVIAMDKYTCAWCKEEQEFYIRSINKSTDEIHTFLKSRDFEYTIVDLRYRFLFFENQTSEELPMSVVNDKIKEIVDSGKFEPVHSTLSTVILKIR